MTVVGDRPNILFLLSDEHSFRHMGHVSPEDGGENVFTPNFDRLARDATRYTDAYCQVPLCTPSRISFLTGLEAQRCGAWANESPLHQDLPTMASVFGNAGYQTCLVGKMHLGGRNQFAGFAERPYGDFTGKTGHQFEPLGADGPGAYTMPWRTRDAGLTEIRESLMQERIVNQEGLAFAREAVSRDPGRPWFLCLSYSRPHFPLTAPPRHWLRYWPSGVSPPVAGPEGVAAGHPLTEAMKKGFEVDRINEAETRRARAGYFACVTYLDEIVGDILTAFHGAGLLDNTIVVYTSDHGELAGEHGLWWKHGWFEACSRVPLLISTPEQREGTDSGREIRRPVGLYDLLPTFCGWAGAPIPEGLSGIDLSAVKSDADTPKRPIVCDALNDRWGAENQFRMVRYGRIKYVRFRGSPDLAFDLSVDPTEQTGLRTDDDNDDEDFVLAKRHAYESIDFDEVEERRLRWQGLRDDIRDLGLPESTGNLYLTKKGKLVNAEDSIYHPTVISDDPATHLTGRGPVPKGGLDGNG